MIARTLYGCVLLALSPAAFAKDMMIGPDCSTSGKDGADWNAISNSIFDIYTQISDFGQILSIAKDIHDVMNAASSKNGLAQQWMSCINEKIETEIARTELSQSLTALQQMGNEMNDTVIPSIADPNISHDDDEKIRKWDLRAFANTIRMKISDPETPNPAAFLVPFDGALNYELAAYALYISKLRDTYDPKKLPGKLHDVASDFTERMHVYRDNLHSVDKESLKDFWDWGVEQITSGHCIDGYFSGLSLFKCTIHDPSPTHRAGRDYNCGEDNAFKCMIGNCDEVCTTCTPDSCWKEYQKMYKVETDIKDKVITIIENMKAKVEMAIKTFDDLVRHIKLT